MSKRNKEYPVIGMRPIDGTPIKDEAKRFEERWAQYAPKVRRTVAPYAIAGAVGGDFEDLIEHAQDVMLQAIRTHDPKRGCFSTHFYTLLHNQLLRVKRIFPKQQFLLTGINYETGLRIRSKPKGSKHRIDGELIAGTGNLEARMLIWRELGYHLAVKDVTPGHRRGTVGQALSIDYEADGEANRNEVNVLICATLQEHRDHGLNESEIVTLIHKAVKDTRLQKITLLLYGGHKAGGRGGIMEQLGLRRFQFERDLQRIRMLLKGPLLWNQKI